METTIVYWGYIVITENLLETTTVHVGYILGYQSGHTCRPATKVFSGMTRPTWTLQLRIEGLGWRVQSLGYIGVITLCTGVIP